MPIRMKATRTLCGMVTLAAAAMLLSSMQCAAETGSSSPGANDSPTSAESTKPYTYGGNNVIGITATKTKENDQQTTSGGGGGSSKTNVQPTPVDHTGQTYWCGQWVPTESIIWSTYCEPTPKTGKTTPQVSVADIVLHAATQITLPDNIPIFSPLPSANQWNMIPVGFPLWPWTTSEDMTISSTVTQDGLTVSLTAARQNILFNMGDGGHPTCWGKLPHRQLNPKDPMIKSTCGYTYQDTGTYTITADTTWLIAWQAQDESGTFTVTRSATSPITATNQRATRRRHLRPNPNPLTGTGVSTTVKTTKSQPSPC